MGKSPERVGEGDLRCFGGRGRSRGEAKDMYYVDVVAVMSALAAGVAITPLLIGAGQGWQWNYKDSVGIGLFVAIVIAFTFFRRQVYEQSRPWILRCLAMLTAAALVVLFRRWSILGMGIGLAILLLGLCARTESIQKRISAKSLLAVSLLMIGSTLFTVALAEGVLRVFPGFLPEGARLRIHWQGDGKRWYVLHPYIGYLSIADANPSARMARPGVETPSVDHWGFRNAWPWPEQAEIVTVGDSVTYSQTVEDDQAWTTILDRALPHSRVLNLGLVGSGPQQHLRIYETFGIDMTPKVLLVGLFLGTDLWDAQRFDLWWASGGNGDLHEFGRKEAPVWGWVKKTYVFTLLQDLHGSYQSGRFLRGRTMQLPDGNRVQLVPSELSNMAKHGRPGAPGFKVVLETLEGIQALAEANQTHPVVLFFPMKEEVYLPLLGERAPDLAAPFIPELAKRGIAYLDLGPYFRQRAAAGETLFWEVDGHPNVRGYALIAEVVLAHLKENAKRYGLKDWEKP